MNRCKAGYPVQISEHGSKFCKAIYDGDTGYVLPKFITLTDE